MRGAFSLIAARGIFYPHVDDDDDDDVYRSICESGDLLRRNVCAFE